jgi:hypothetical protein
MNLLYFYIYYNSFIFLIWDVNLTKLLLFFMFNYECYRQGVLWFNIGSVDSFERNLENAQVEMNVEPPNFVPVVYKSELEAASVTGLLPTLLIIGKKYIAIFNISLYL